MAVYLSSFGFRSDGLFLIDETACRVLAVIEHPSYWDPAYQLEWIDNPFFWTDKVLKDSFRDRDLSRVMEFKGKTYVNLGEHEGFRKWRGIDKLQDSHDQIISFQSGEEDVSDS